MNINNIDVRLIFLRTRLRTNKTKFLIMQIKIILIIGENRFYHSKPDCIGMRSIAPLNFTGDFSLLAANIFGAASAGVIDEKKVHLYHFRRFITL